MAAKTSNYTARNGRTYRIVYDRSKIVTTALEYTYEINIDERKWTSYYGITQTALGTRSGATLLATLGERGLRFLCDALDKGEETPFRAIEQKDGSKYLKKLA
ncbi:hypothetical protein EPA93_10990 [Ktedonosporobacter rubrisoli]|uniref:Uncharacterized protein n=1 Tax=Ktedonosporobacter rubrisoli TaxID=2509675 RepID=A0A4P6JP29_KTERU|nr:hypothetical protein [Ktedonosporobacter rubrisoli]QBD76506.1 hypothetical protein EPA93_10990 [Ktedonosporobacter rubrisoli]